MLMLFWLIYVIDIEKNFRFYKFVESINKIIYKLNLIYILGVDFN